VILLDTTVLVYAVGDDHGLREPARAVLRAVAERRLQATTTVEVIQEFLHVRARRRSRADAIAGAAAYMTLLSPLLTIDEAMLTRALALFGAHGRIGAFDAVLAAATMAQPDASLISADRAFAEVTGLVCHDLAAPELIGALGIGR
jgi:uncharacterized protein